MWFMACDLGGMSGTKVNLLPIPINPQYAQVRFVHVSSHQVIYSPPSFPQRSLRMPQFNKFNKTEEPIYSKTLCKHYFQWSAVSLLHYSHAVFVAT